ncbi:MAG: SDR family oxidoreductase [Bdellovibrionales bacterium]|nr:SDR family oxidoreductase [Bdellovibrionales bacterium]
MANILLTGAAGFIGSHLATELTAHGHFVLGIDNFCTGRSINLDGLKTNKDFDFLEHDISKPFPIACPVSRMKFDWVMHFASPASPPKYFAIPIETMLVNGEGTRHLLDFAHASRAKFFYSSTSEVYGDPLVHPQTESYWGNVNPIGVRSIYDEGKRYGEAITYAYHRAKKLDVRVIRIFNTYGPKMDPEDGRVVTNLLMQAIRGQEFTIYGDGKQTRSFQYVSDLIEGVIRLMDVDYNQPVNLGNPNEFTILELAKEIEKLTGKALQMTFRPLPSDDPKQRKPDITTAQRLLNWEPRVQLAEGLKLTHEYFAKI